MSETPAPGDLQEAVERSYRAQWGGRRFCLVVAIVLVVLSLLAGAALVVAKPWFSLSPSGLKIVEIAALTTSFVCLVLAVLAGLEALVRWQRERGQFPARSIHYALLFSIITVATLAFLCFVHTQSWVGRGIELRLANVIEFILFLFAGMVWLCAVVMSSAGITMLVTRRTDLLDINDTDEGTALLFRKGHSAEIIKLSIASIIPLILFVVALLIGGARLI